jgi:hypothetical protein
VRLSKPRQARNQPSPIGLRSLAVVAPNERVPWDTSRILQIQFWVDRHEAGTYGCARESIANAIARRMNSAINFVELENRIIAATYRNLMVRAKVVLVDKQSGAVLAEPVTTITSTMPVGSLRIRLPETVRPGIYFLRARNAHGEDIARSAEFSVG